MITIALIVTIPLIILSIIGQKKIHIKSELTINKNTDDVWEVMGKQFGDVHLWSSNFKNSKPAGDKIFEGIDYSQRITLTDRGETIQVLDTFDSANYKLTYHSSKGLPEIAKTAVGIWSLKPIQNNQTMVVLEFNMESKNIIGYLLSPIIKLNFPLTLWRPFQVTACNWSKYSSAPHLINSSGISSLANLVVVVTQSIPPLILSLLIRSIIILDLPILGERIALPDVFDGINSRISACNLFFSSGVIFG